MIRFRRILFSVDLIAQTIFLGLALPRAAEMRLTPNGEFYFVGRIVSGDLERFRAALKTLPEVKTIHLRSQGGSLMEAIRIGRAVKELYLDTAAPVSPAVNRHASPKDNCSDDPAEVREGARCLCASACFFIWGRPPPSWRPLIFARPYYRPRLCA